jgi:hypothetical protein
MLWRKFLPHTTLFRTPGIWNLSVREGEVWGKNTIKVKKKKKKKRGKEEKKQ